MVNAFGYYASAKGMVLVPDLSGLSSSAAISALESSGLDYFLGTDVNTSNQALDNLVAQQDPVSNTLVDYGTVVSFSLYNFVATPPFFPFFPTPAVYLTATATGETSVALSWSIANFSQGSWRISRDGFETEGVVNSTTQTSTTNSGLTCGTGYSYTITIFSGPDGTGESISDTATVTTNSCSAPTLTVSASASGPSVLVSWNQIAGAASYVANTSYNAESPQTLNGIANTSTTFEALSGIAYTYTVTAYSGADATGTQLATGSTTFTLGAPTPPFFPPSFPFFPPTFAPTPVGDPILGPCQQVFSGACLANGGGFQTVTQNYSDGSQQVTTQCCVYIQ